MSVSAILDVLDATRLCQPVIEPTAWVIAPPAPSRPELPVLPALPALPATGFSWWSLARNPQALLLTGVIAAGLVQDAVLRVVEPATPSPTPRRARGW